MKGFEDFHFSLLTFHLSIEEGRYDPRIHTKRHEREKEEMGRGLTRMKRIPKERTDEEDP